jgi:arylsulfatase A-like enzyme/Flp pilus assembly protein TadD
MSLNFVDLHRSILMRGRTVGVILCALSLLALTLPAVAAPPARTASSHPKPSAPAHAPDRKSSNIVLITLDTTRADRMGFLGSERGLTPNLDALAKQSAVFTHAYSQIPLTTGSHATILTGTYPQFHLLNDLRDPLSPDLPDGPEILQAHGYHTAAFLGSIILNSASPFAAGFDRGFQTYDAGFANQGPGEDRYHTVQRRGSEVVAHALAWLTKHPSGPFFVWVHLYDAHDPYDPPEPYKSRYASEPYDGGIAYEDAVVGRLFQQLKARGLYDNTIVAVMADHGESLGAHGEETHGIFLYDETIRVPLLIKLPHQAAGGRGIEARVELTDVMPTLLQEVSIEIPKEMQGQSLLNLMTAESRTGESRTGEADAGKSPEAVWRDRPAYAQSIYPHSEFGWSALRSLRTQKYLYVQAPRRELYDQSADPTADHNLASTSPAVADTLAEQTEAFRKKTSSLREAQPSAVNQDAQEALGALGYLASARGPSTGTPVDQGSDPKDMIEDANLLHRAQALQQDMHGEESIALLEKLLAKEPDLALYSTLGNWMVRQNEYKRAVPVFRKAMEQDRESPMSHLRLGRAMVRAGDFENGIPELEITEAKLPQLVDTHLLLQMAYTQLNRVPDAIRESRIVLHFIPDHYPSYLILGRLLTASGDADGAIASLKKASALEPKSPDPHMLLADVYSQAGRKADAAREQAVAKRLGKNSKTPQGNTGVDETH